MSSPPCGPRRRTFSTLAAWRGPTAGGTGSSAPCRGSGSSMATPAGGRSGSGWSRRSCRTSSIRRMTDPCQGREEEWSLVTEYRVRLAQEERQWAEAERLQTVRVDWDRQRAAPALARPAGELESGERNAIRTLAVSLHELGQIRRELGRAECVPAYEEALELSERIGERAGAAICAFNLGHAFIGSARPPRPRPGRALVPEEPRAARRDATGWGVARCLGQLGTVAWERFREARAAGRPEEELLRHLNEAARLYHEALDLLPPDAVNDLAVTHNQLGAIYGDAGDLDRAVQHYREAIQLRGASRQPLRRRHDPLQCGPRPPQRRPPGGCLGVRRGGAAGVRELRGEGGGG